MRQPRGGLMPCVSSAAEQLPRQVVGGTSPLPEGVSDTKHQAAARHSVAGLEN